MYTDGYIQLADKHLRETPISTTPFPNYINTCSTNTTSNTAIKKKENTVDVPGFVAYPYLDDPFDDIDNQDKYLLYNYNNSPDAGFSFIFNEVNNYYSQFCKHIPFIHGSIDMDAQLLHSYNQQLFISIFNIINLYNNQKDTISNNINYLKYFYHLFPTHVEKFYSLFDRYLNHRFLQLKSSIGCLVYDISSLCSFISRLQAIKCNFNQLRLHGSIIYSMLFSQVRDFNQKLTRVVLLNEQASKLALKRITEDLRSKIDSARGNLKAIKTDIIGVIELKIRYIEKELEKHRKYIEEKLKWYIEYIHSNLISLKNYSQHRIEIDLARFEHMLDGLCNKMSRISYDTGYMERLRYIRPGIRFGEIDASLIGKFRLNLSVFLSSISEIKSSISSVKEKIKEMRSLLGRFKIATPDMKINDYHHPSKFLSKIKPIKNELKGLIPIAKEMYPIARDMASLFLPIQNKINQLQGSIVPIKKYLDRPFLDGLGDIRLSERWLYLDFIEDDIDRLKMDIRKIMVMLENTSYVIRYLRAIDPLVLLEYHKVIPSSPGEEDEDISRMERYLQAFKHLEPHVRKYSKSLKTKYRNLRKKSDILDESEMFEIYISGFGGKLRRKTESHVTSLKIIKAMCRNLSEMETKLGSLEDETKNNNGQVMTEPVERLQDLSSKFNDFLKITSNINHIRVYYSAKDVDLKRAESDIEGFKSLMVNALNLKNYIDNNSILAVYIDSIKKGVESKTQFVKGLSNLAKILNYSLNQIDIVIGTYKSLSCKIVSLKHKESNMEDISQIKGDILYVRRIIHSIRDDIDCISTITKNLCLVKSIFGEIGDGLFCLLDEIDKQLDETKKNINVSYVRHFVFAFLRGEEGTPVIDGLKCAKKYLTDVKRVVITIRTVLNLLISGIREAVRSEQTSTVIKKIETILEGVRGVESSIENIICCFLKCSNKSITNNTIKSTKGMLASGGQVYNNELAKQLPHTRDLSGSEKKDDNVWELLSNMGIIESKFVASKLYESITNTDEALKKLLWIENCGCIEYSDPGDIGRKFMRYIEKKFDYNKHREYYKYVIDNRGNHLCICLVINYVLYPTVLQCLCYLIHMDFDTLSTISRKFDKYTGWATYKSEVSRFLVFVVAVCMKISDWVYERYAPVLASCKFGESICFCGCHGDVYYKYFISNMIYISYLVDNTFITKGSTISDLVQSISSLYDQINNSCIDSSDINLVTIKFRPREFICSSISSCDVGEQCQNGCSCGTCLKCKTFCLCLTLFCQMIGIFAEQGGSGVQVTCDSQPPQQTCCICVYLKGSIQCLSSMVCWQCPYGCICSRTDNGCCCQKIFSCVGKLSKQCSEIKSVLSKFFKDKVEKIRACKQASDGPCGKPFCSTLTLSGILTLKKTSEELSCIIYGCYVVLCATNADNTRLAIQNNFLDRTFRYIEYIVRGVRDNKVYRERDEIVGLEKSGVKDITNNHYSYNDAYRINKSRAHGSLKYIIIKLVLILIIVVMTIFIRVKIESDDDYKMDNLLADENGTCECSVENNENGGETNNGMNIKYSGTKNKGTRKTSRTKGMKKKSLMIVMSVISGLYLNVVIRDLYVVLSLEYNVWSYFVSVVVCLGLTCSLLSRYCVHLYDFVYVLEQYGLKMSKVESLVDDKFGGESGTSMISSQFVMLYGLLKSVVGDLTSALSMSVSQSSYNEMKDELYPYKNMAGALHRMISGSDEYLSNLGKLRESVMESAIVGGCVDLYNVLDFLSYVLMSKTFFEFDEYQAYFHGNERYVAWRLGKSLNHNFFLVSYYRYSTIYSIDAQVQNLRLGEKHMATRNCMMLWRMFGEMEIELITLRSMCEESLDVPMTDIQKDLLKSRFVDEYLTEFQKFQLYVVSTLFNVREHTRVRTREIESSFPFADLFNEQMLDKGRLSKLSAKYFDTNYRRLLSSMSLPTRTCDVSGHVEEVQRRVSAFCSHWLDLRYEYCKSIRSLGCEKAVNFAHDLVMSTLKEPEQIDTKITQMLANINLENIDFIQQLLETDETLKEKYQLKEFHSTLDTLTHIHPISDNYETTVLHYLNQYVISSLLNKDKIMLPLGIYLSWYGAALTEQHISCIH